MGSWSKSTIFHLTWILPLHSSSYGITAGWNNLKCIQSLSALSLYFWWSVSPSVTPRPSCHLYFILNFTRTSFRAASVHVARVTRAMPHHHCTPLLPSQLLPHAAVGYLCCYIIFFVELPMHLLLLLLLKSWNTVFDQVWYWVKWSKRNIYMPCKYLTNLFEIMLTNLWFSTTH